MTTYHGGHTFYGQPIGILMADTTLPRIPGDSGNAWTYDFPVRFKVVKGATAPRMIEDTDHSLLGAFIDAAHELEEEGCQAITTSCGFLIMFQKELAAACNVPVFTSGLLQAPMVANMLAPHKKVGILTANSDTLDTSLFLEGSLTKDRIVVQGMQEFPNFYSTFPRNGFSYDYEAVEAEMVAAGKKLMETCPDIGAIVCEGTNMATFNPAVCRATGVPVFDIITLIRFVASGVLRGMTHNIHNRIY
jgi:Asp/Glu/hydantoin racemase